MILIPILLALGTGVLILRLCNQHKFLNIFEQLALGFVMALSLFVFELFLEGIVFDKLSLILPIVTFMLSLGIFIYKCIKYKYFRKEILNSIKHTFSEVKLQFILLKERQKYVVILILIYVLLKLFMVFSINTHMPTFDEDAVGGRDIKTKIFTENKSLVLDKSSPEFLGSALERNIFAPLTDTYFLLSNDSNTSGYTNIVSALFYCMSILILFGIILRKTNLLFAMLGAYIFASLPFVFIHGLGAYRNFIGGVFIFIVMFYLIDQILNLDKNNPEKKSLKIPLMIILFLASTIRNESVILIIISFVTIFIINYFTRKGEKINIMSYVVPLIGVVIGYLSGKFILKLYPADSSLIMGNPKIGDILPNLSANQDLFVAPFKQMFFHPDYILLYLLFSISIILFIRNYKKMEKLLCFFVLIIVLMGVSILILFSDMGMGILTHFAYIRYSIFLVPFIIYFTTMSLFLSKNE